MNRFFSSIPARFAMISGGLFLAFALLARISLLVTSWSEISPGIPTFGAIVVGILFDISASVFAAAPWLLLGILLPERILKTSWAKYTLAALAALAVVYSGIFIFITTAEWFFWDEFGARFNFIAVDYLVWTQEVWGNIAESYPMGVIIPAIVILAGLVVFGLKKASVFRVTDHAPTMDRHRFTCLAILRAAPFLTTRLISQSATPAFTNQYNTELAKNGCWAFFAAFKQMELDFQRWYLELPHDEVLSSAHDLLDTPAAKASFANPQDLSRTITTIGTPFSPS